MALPLLFAELWLSAIKRMVFSIKILCVPKIYLKKMQSADH